MLVPATASCGVAIRTTIGFTSTTSMTVNATAIPIKSVMVLPMIFSACSMHFAPTLCPIVTVVPIASPTIMTVIMCMI